MNLPWRLWVMMLSIVAMIFAIVGTQPRWSELWWPFASIWLTVTLSAFGLSIFAAVCFVLLGLSIDLMTDAPLGAWPLAFLMSYMVGVFAWERSPPVPPIMVEAFTLIFGLVVVTVCLALASGVAGYSGFSVANLLSDFAMTIIAYPLMRGFLLPREVLGGAR